MSAAVTLSDIASMGAAPKYLLIAVGLDDWKCLAGVMQGAKDCCTRFGAGNSCSMNIPRRCVTRSMMPLNWSSAPTGI